MTGPSGKVGFDGFDLVRVGRVRSVRLMICFTMVFGFLFGLKLLFLSCSPTPSIRLRLSATNQPRSTQRSKCKAAMAEPGEQTQAVLQSTSSEKAQQSCLLAELTPSNCGIGTWILRVVQPRVIEYVYTWQGQQRQGKRQSVSSCPRTVPPIVWAL